MNDSDFLLRHGWRKIGERREGHGLVKYWDHADHQPNVRGAFTTTAAVKHQKDFIGTGWCDCIKWLAVTV